MSIFDAAMIYQKENVPLVILAVHEYGTGSSRDWAAKGTRLLGLKAVIAASFERIHRSNLVGMGVLPLQFPDGTNAQALSLDGSEMVSISGLSASGTGLRSARSVAVIQSDHASSSWRGFARSLSLINWPAPPSPSIETK